MKILLLITSWDFGGAEVQVHLLAQKFSMLGHNVKIVSMIPVNVDFNEKYYIQGVEVASIDMKRGKPSINSIFRLKKIISDFQPDVVHAHMVHAVIFARITKIISKIPKLVCTAHSINEGGFFRDLMYKFSDFLSDHNTNVSKIGTDLYLKKGLFSKNKTLYMPNGIELKNLNFPRININEAFNISPQTFVFLAVGRLEPAKDYFNLLEAVKHLIEHHPKINFCVLVAGDGSLREEIELKIDQLNLKPYVKLIGKRNDILSLMSSVDAFVMSSAWEGLPISILEAQSVGLPCVVTEVGGCKEAVIDGYNGYSMPSQNPIALAEKMEKIASLDSKELDTLKSNSLKFMKENYDINIIVEKWIDMYRS